MKNKKIFIALLLVASLALGIGYAALTTTLTINGTAGVSAEALQFTEDVVFVGASSDNPNFGTAEIINAGQDATFAVSGMTRAGEKVRFTYTIKNGSTTPVSIEVATIPTTSDTSHMFSVSTVLSANEIAVGDSVIATVIVELNQDATVVVDPISYFMSYTATSIGTP